MYYLSSLLTRSVARSALQARIPRYYLSDRLNEVRTQSVAGRNKIEDYLSDRLNEVRTQSVAGRNKIEDYLRKSSKSPFIGNRCVREHYRATSDKDLFFGCPGVG